MKTKNYFLFVAVIAVINFLFTTKANCQGALSFSSDSIVVESCDDVFQLIGIIKMYTQTKEEVRIRWDITELRSLDPGEVFLIVDPYQYPPYTTGAYTNIHSDTTDILFHMLLDTLLPGDTALFQIGVYDTKDSANTYQLLTTILTCPLASATTPIEPNNKIRIYPNPFNVSTTLQILDNLKFTQIIIYNLMGEVVKTIDINSNETELYRDDLPEGAYLICLMKDHMITSTAKVVVTD